MIQSSSCIPASTRTLNDGYPMKKIKGRLIRLHRLALEQQLGRSIRPGLYALHTCGNRWCINGEHLYEGTHRQNMEDMKLSGRSRNCGSTRKLTDSQVLEIRHRLSLGELGKNLAAEFGVAGAQISRIKHGKSYPRTGTEPVV